MPATGRNAGRAKSSKSGERDDPARTPEQRQGVQSVARAFEVIDVLRGASAPMSALEVSRATGLDRTVVHRLLRGLCEERMAIEEDGAYRLGPAPVLLANRYLDNLLVRRLAMPYLIDLQTEVVGELPNTVSLSIPVGDVITVIERIWTLSAPLDVVLDIGDVGPIDGTAAGRALLSCYPAEEAEELLGAERLAAVADTLEEVRAAGGIGLARGDVHRGIDAVAAAVRSRRSRPVAAIVVSGPELGEEAGYDSALAARLRRAADAIGQSIA